jgi:DNA mismatch repair protein MutL
VPKIHLLPDQLISQIAAGEVVERPASVVKELVENSLDAGALEIRLELEGGGKRRIRLSDDGHGMGRDDALLAFDRHATSKIDTFQDLEKVATLGFRGEALASIAAVARVELLTAEESGEATRVRIEGGKVKVAEPAARARGTTLEIASLFFNVPARRKFLKTPDTELRRCLEVVQGYALARPEVRFSVLHEGRALLETLPVAAGEEGLRERIGQIFGAPFARDLTSLGSAPVDDPASGAADLDEIAAWGAVPERIHGFVGSPETRRGRRLFVFVNRRLLRDRSVLATFYRAVREVWRSDDYPALFLFLDLPPEEVDVNVHPQKAEVRFRDPGLLHRLMDGLRGALERARGEVPAPLREPSAGPGAPFAWQGLGERPRTGHDFTGPNVAGPGEDAYPPASPPGGGQATTPWWRASEIRDGGAAADLADRRTSASEAASRLATAAFAPLDRPTVPLSGRSGEARPFRLLGQYKGTLILLEGPDGLYLIDQHVAHERILYERLRRDLARQSPPSQGLVTPLLLELSPAEALRLTELATALEGCGFRLEPLSGNAVAVAAIPAALGQEEAEKILLGLAAGDGGPGQDPEALARELLETLAANLSCRNAVKMHHPLAAEEMEALVAELFGAENPYSCPHGRPIVLQMTDGDLERRFGRRK